MTTTIKFSHKPEYTLFVPFTRLWFVDRFLLNLERMELPWEAVDVLFYNDTNNAELQSKLLSWLERFKPILNGARIYQSGNPPLGEFDVMQARRDRIVRVKQHSAKLIGNSKYVFCLEDDTIAPTDALERLEHYFLADPLTAVASGVQVGRWAYRIIGAWEISPLLDPTNVRTVAYQGTGAQEVDGTGWFCYLTTTQLYKATKYRYEAECLGPDVCYGWDLKKNGYKVFLDWDVSCAHVAIDQTFYPDNSVGVAEWRKTDGIWTVLPNATMNV